MSKVLPSEAELRESYTAFHESAFGLLDQVDKDEEMRFSNLTGMAQWWITKNLTKY